jgi:hypothetical protein
VDLGRIDARQPPDIVFSELQVIEEVQELVPWAIATGCATRQRGFGERLFLHGKCRFEIDLRCLDGLMTEPQGDDPPGPRLPAIARGPLCAEANAP